MEGKELATDPLVEFKKWFQTAIDSGEPKHEAFVLGTVSAEGFPSVRVLLFKGLTDGAFTFYTNYESRKGRELSQNPNASMVFHWPKLGRQVRIAGQVEKTTYEQSNSYFQSRPRGSQLSAYVSPQGQVIASRGKLEKLRQEMEEKFEGRPIPCPHHWGGYKLRPCSVEFWQERPDRFHDRFHYRLEQTEEAASAHPVWILERLAP